MIYVQCQSSKADLILHYEAENNATDSSAFGNHGALANGTTYGSGMIGNAFVFDGINDTVEGPVLTQINPNQFSIAMWVKAVPNNGLVLLADSSHGGNRGGSVDWTGFALQIGSNNRVDFAYGNNSTFPHVMSNAVIADNTFHHVAATFDGTTLSMYIDGVLDNTAAYSGTATVSGRNFRLGNHDQLTSRAFEGTLDDVRVYNETLSAGQVAGLASIPEPGSALAIGLIGLGLISRRRRR